MADLPSSTAIKTVLKALRKSIARWTDTGDQLVTAIPGLTLYRRDGPTEPTSFLYEPSICVATQGVKRVLLGGDTFVYDAQHFLITSVDLPTVTQVIKASREQPCLVLMLRLDPQEISQLMAESNLPLLFTFRPRQTTGHLTPCCGKRIQLLITGDARDTICHSLSALLLDGKTQT